jgi:DNA-binding beta-propeller fold protein YncE
MENSCTHGRSRPIRHARFHWETIALLIVALSGAWGCGGGTSPSVESQSALLTPTITTISPNSTPACGAAFTLTINGTNFVASSVVRWNGSDQPTAYATSNQLTAQISTSDIAAAGTAAVTVFDPPPGGGSSNSLPFTTSGAVGPQSIAVDPIGKSAYVLNSGCNAVGGSVSMYTISPTTGALASIGPAVSTSGFGVYPGSIAVEPLGKFAYVTNEGDPWGYEDGSNGSIAMYTIDATTGALTSAGVTNGNCPGLCDPSSMVVDPSGKFAYVVTGGASIPFNIAMYTINATTGALTSIGTVAAGQVPISIAVDPAGKFVYVVTQNITPGLAGNVSMYTINATTGALTSVGTIAAGTEPVFVAVDPAGKFAYVANSGSNNVSMYSINTTTGMLTSVGAIAAGTNPSSAAVDPTGKFAYIANSGSSDVSMYSIDATTGALTSMGTIAAGSNPTSIAIHPSGKFAYVTNSASNDVSMYSVDTTTGILTLIGTIGS